MQRHTLQDATGVLESAPNIGHLQVAARTVPSNGTKGYAPGCIFQDIDGTVNANFYINNGTYLSCLFQPITGTDLTGLTATAAEINANNTASAREVLAGATLTITQALHDGRTVRMPAVCAITLPAATGSGARYRLVNAVDATAVTITATGAHLFGNAWLISDNSAAVLGYTAAGSTIITMDGSTQGGLKGGITEIEDVATSILITRYMSKASGTEATPFS